MVAVSEQTGAFRTHRQYLAAFAYIAAGGEKDLIAAYRGVRERIGKSPNLPRMRIDIASNPKIRSSLENAWGTELLLWLGDRFLGGDEIVRVSNTWNVVQAYYALYHMTHALLLAKNNPAPDTHEKTQRMFVDLWGRLPMPFAPWSLTFGPAGHAPHEIQRDPALHTWSAVSEVSCWSIAFKALETTRLDAVNEHIRQSRERKKSELRKAWALREERRRERSPKKRPEPRFPLPLLTAAERAGAERNTRAFSLLDYLYRLRVRSNYEDHAVFTDGPESPGEAADVRRYLLMLVSSSCFATEIMLCNSPDGHAHVKGWATRWAKSNVPQGVDIGVARRIGGWKTTS